MQNRFSFFAHWVLDAMCPRHVFDRLHEIHLAAVVLSESDQLERWNNNSAWFQVKALTCKWRPAEVGLLSIRLCWAMGHKNPSVVFVMGQSSIKRKGVMYLKSGVDQEIHQTSSALCCLRFCGHVMGFVPA